MLAWKGSKDAHSSLGFGEQEIVISVLELGKGHVVLKNFLFLAAAMPENALSLFAVIIFQPSYEMTRFLRNVFIWLRFLNYQSF